MLGLILSSLMLVNLGIDPAVGCFGSRPNCTGRIDEGVTFEDSYELTMEAFDFCDSDEDGCLTWKEIEPCEVRIFAWDAISSMKRRTVETSAAVEQLN